MTSKTSRSDTPDEIRTYRRSDVIVVYRTKDAFGGLSNMASGFPLYVNGVHILTSEALYQACRFPHLPDVQRVIIEQHSPMTAKMKSKPHREHSRGDWDDVRFRVMRWCLRVKLAQNFDTFGKLLLTTHGKPIVEQSRKDAYWGATVSDDGDETLMGQNVLGRLLMELRGLVESDGASNLMVVHPLNIPDFLLFGRPIRDVSAEQDKRWNDLSQRAMF